MRNCTIYKITNFANEKVYVGQTWCSITKRFNEHKKSDSNKKLFYAMNKYGRDNFLIQMLSTTITQEDADYWEIFYITEYNSINNGYNIREGGSRGKQSEETKIKISVAHIGKMHSIHTKEKMSKSRIGLNPSIETRIKMSKSKLGENHPKSKLTWDIVGHIREDYNTGLVSYRELAAKYDTDYGTVGKIINNKIWKL